MSHNVASGIVCPINVLHEPANRISVGAGAKAFRQLGAKGPVRQTEGDRWYLVYTQPHREFRAQTQLAAQGYRTFLPRYRKTIRHMRKLTTVSAPFFPRYVFVALDLGRDRWRSVNGTFGVATLVMGDEFPRPVPHGVVEGLIGACYENEHLCLGNSLEVGERVRVLTGPFADLVGELTRIDGAQRVRVLLKLLGGWVAVSIQRDGVVPTLAA